MRGVLAVPLLFAACAPAQRDKERPLDLDALYQEWPELRGLVRKASEVRDSFPPPGPDPQIVRVFGPAGADERAWHPGWRLSDLRPSEPFLERQVIVLRSRRVIIVADLRADENLALWPDDAVIFRKLPAFERPVWSFIVRAIGDPELLDRYFSALREKGQFRSP